MKQNTCIEFYLPLSTVWVGVGWDIEEGRKIQVDVPGIGLVSLKPLACFRDDHVIHFGAMEVIVDEPSFKLGNSQSGLVSGVFDETSGYVCLRNGPPPVPERKPKTESGRVYISRYLAS